MTNEHHANTVFEQVSIQSTFFQVAHLLFFLDIIMIIRPSQHGLLWEGLDPTWTVMPDPSVIGQLAKQHLPQNFSDIAVDFFAEGALNKIYTIASPYESQQYLMRVALPVEPFYKTESEAATLAYVSKYTTLPVPEVIAYDSSSENDLGFEWMLLKKIRGVPVSEVWESMRFGSKACLTVQISNYMKELHCLQFSQIGNIYFSAIKDRVNSGIDYTNIESEDSDVSVDCGIGSEFVIGRMVSPWFFRDKRVWLPANRGPFSSSSDLMAAKTQIQIERINNLSPSPGDEYYSDNDEELAEDKDEVLEICCTLKTLVPTYFFPWDTLNEQIQACSSPYDYEAKGNRNLIHHDDLSERNILVDPTSFQITGILDWESVAVRPAWECYEYPYILRGYEISEPPKKGTPGIDEDGLVEFRKDWERVRLRFLYRWLGFTSTTFLPSTTYADSWNYHMTIRENFTFVNGVEPTDDAISLMRQFAEVLENIEVDWRSARRWLEEQTLKRKDSHEGKHISQTTLTLDCDKT